MKINTKLLPLKCHFFFFMGSMGPIFPHLQVFGKELGISSLIMGTVTGILPIIFLIAKPTFGVIVDIYKEYRKLLVAGLICVGGLSFTLLYFIPTRIKCTNEIKNDLCIGLQACNLTTIESSDDCVVSKRSICTSSNRDDDDLSIKIYSFSNIDCYNISHICSLSDISHCNISSNYTCNEATEIQQKCMYKMWQFWLFIVSMAIGTIACNIGYCVSDAICFDLIEQDRDYGKQRMWGTVGYGVGALISGGAINWYSEEYVNYSPAFIILLIFLGFEMITFIKLKLPIIKKPDNLFKSMRKLLNTTKTKVFICFAIFSGIFDGYVVYYLFWYLEDLAVATQTANIKLLEGLMIAVQTLISETLFFLISGKILEKLGHATCFSLCFFFYGVRFAVISIAPNPWWVFLSEIIMQGPTYALTYSTIVAYANAIAPPGASATMQGIVAGMDDCFGYSIGSFLGGLLYKYVGGTTTFQILSAFGFVCCISHFILQNTLLKEESPKDPAKQNTTDISAEENAQLEKLFNGKYVETKLEDT